MKRTEPDAIKNMRKGILNTFVLAGSPLLLLSSCTKKNAENPNFIVFIADDVSRDDIGCYGNAVAKTPNIDRLAASGIKFNNMFLTASSSSPSRNSIITGRYPHNTGGSELHSTPPDHMVAFTEILKEKGYHTVQAGKFHMGPYARRGFDDINDNSKLNGDGGEALWLKCMKDRPPEKPFLMWFASYDAHRIWGPNEFTGTHNPSAITPPFYLAGGEGTKEDLAKYYDEIHRFDHYIGLVYEELIQQGVADNTFIIIMADNGRPFPHSKTRVNDRGLRTPFIVHWPAGRGHKPQECTALLSAIDIAPTILELAGAEIPEHIQGCSFTSLLHRPSEGFRNYVFAEHNWHDYEAHERMVRSDKFLYILNSRPQFPQTGPADAISSPSFRELDSLRQIAGLTSFQSDIFIAPRPSEEFYDCDSDPDQFDNIADNQDLSEVKNEMSKILKEWMQETGDNIPDSITKDWYERVPGNVKTKYHSIRGEPVDRKFNATLINNKGMF
ncbi:MAG TPA: sulfatase [Bacteroidales bacterium]|nr:sulfatase [Bacteroidales bacterium]HPF03786.1 sulfatase [Bacteroidales bacterium]HPJ60052.1 sulfatase [Bacteroidales bacterium]HPR11744.1 sulfatase [Bacteroidales bacterium]HRW85448.1 sulfatase [Bacteroidales bacterium]